MIGCSRSVLQRSNERRFEHMQSPKTESEIEDRVIYGKTMIVVLHSEQAPWDAIIRHGQFITWLENSESENIRTFYCFGKPPGRFTRKIDEFNEYLRWNSGPRISSLRNIANKIFLYPFRNYVPKATEEVFYEAPKGVKRLKVKFCDMYLTTRWRQLSVIQFFLEQQDFEFLMFITSATYLNLDKLKEVIGRLNSEYIYAGPLLGDPRNIQFVSGAQTLLNRNSASILLKNRRLIPIEILNDLGMGIAFARLGIKPQKLKTINISSLDHLIKTDQSELKNCHHFRLKSLKNNKRNDAEVFIELHKRLNQ